MASKHLFRLSQQTPHDKTEAGQRIKADINNFPVLKGMSFYKLTLQPKGVREPHWHANADELGYCLAGEALINLYQSGDIKASFLVKPGDVFLIPSGTLHDVENTGTGIAEFILCFSHESVEDFGLSGTLGVFSNAVLGNTWSVQSSVFETLKRSTTSNFATFRQNSPAIPEQARYESPYRYNLAGSQPLITNDGGSAKMARQNLWPIATKQALYSLELTDTGMREPHWHPETAELGYVEKGQGRMSILSPSGSVDTYIMNEGDIYFIPKAYPHHIENLKDETLHLLIFFDQGMPEDIGLTGSVRSFSDETLASTTKSAPDFYFQLKKYYEDQFIVERINSRD